MRELVIKKVIVSSWVKVDVDGPFAPDKLCNIGDLRNGRRLDFSRWTSDCSIVPIVTCVVWHRAPPADGLQQAGTCIDGTQCQVTMAVMAL